MIHTKQKVLESVYLLAEYYNLKENYIEMNNGRTGLERLVEKIV